MHCFEHLSIELENNSNSLLSSVNWVQKKHSVYSRVVNYMSLHVMNTCVKNVIQGTRYIISVWTPSKECINIPKQHGVCLKPYLHYLLQTRALLGCKQTRVQVASISIVIIVTVRIVWLWFCYKRANWLDC